MLAKLKRKIYILSKRGGDLIGIDLPYFIENGFWMFLNQFVSLITTFGVSIVFARFLTKEVYGQYQLILSFIGLFAIVSLPGLNTSIARSVAKQKEYSYIIGIKTSFKWSLIGIPFFLVIVSWYYFKGDVVISLVLIISSIFFPAIQSLNKWPSYYIGKSSFNKIALNNIIQNSISGGLYIVIAILYPENIIIIIGTYLIANVVFKLVWHSQIQKKIRSNLIDDECIPYGKFTSKAALFTQTINHFDKVIIGFLDIELLAVYAIAIKLLDAFKVLTKSIFSVSFPKFVKQKVKIKNKTVVLLMSIGLFISLLLYIAAEPVVNYFYTVKYIESAYLFKKLIFILPFVFINPLLSNKAFAEANKTMIIKIRVLVPLITLVCSVLVILISKSPEYFVITKIYVLQITLFIFLKIK